MDINRPVVLMDSKKQFIFSESNRPVVPMESNRPVVTIDKKSNRPVVFSDSNRPVISTESNRPVLDRESNRPVAPTENNRPVVPTESNRPVVPMESNRPVVIIDKKSNRPVVSSNSNRPVISTESNRPILDRESNRPVVPTENNRPVVPTESNRPVVHCASNLPVVPSEMNRPVVPRDSNSNKPVVSSDSNRPVVLIDSNSNRPVVSSDSNRPVVFTESNRPVLNRESNRPVVTIESNRPFVFTKSNRPVIPKDSKSNRPVAPTNTNRPVIPSDSNRPVVSCDSNKPVIPTESNIPVVPLESNLPVVPLERNRPVVPRDSNSNRPVVSCDSNKPVIPTESNIPVVPLESNLPVVPLERNRPVVPRDNNSNRPVAPTDSNRPVVPSDSNIPCNSNKSLVSIRKIACAINFGTTYSSYAYSMKSDPLRVHCPYWNLGTSSLISYKTRTTVLLDGERNFVAFGYEAERKYSELDVDKADEHFYFRRFKKTLYDRIKMETLSTETKISDIKEKELPALDIFSYAIKYLMNHLHDELNRKGIEIQHGDIQWVLTVPAIWNDPAKQFIRKAAEKAGIESERLVLALESEAASIYCKEVSVEKITGSWNIIDVFSTGNKYLVLDARDESIDMTVHEVTRDRKLQVLSTADTGDLGGLMVDNTFKDMLIAIAGDNFLEKYCKEVTSDYIEMLKEFELKKYQNINETSQLETFAVKIPPTFLHAYKSQYGRDISQRIKETKYSDKLKFTGDKLRMKKDLFESFFKSMCEETIKQVRKLLADPNVKETDTILMVGCCSESEIFREAVRNAFPNCRIIIPKEADLAVLKGAVIFGHAQV